MQKPTTYLDEIQERLYAHTGTDYNLNAIRTTLLQLEYTPKFLRYIHDRACEADEKYFHWYISSIPPRAMVLVDECSIRKEDPEQYEDWPLKGPPEGEAGL